MHLITASTKSHDAAKARVWGLVCGVLVFLGLISSAMAAPCMRYYKAKNWTRAARCFAAIAARMGRGRSLSDQRKLRKARLLQNAAQLYARAARRKRLRTRVRFLNRGRRYLRRISRERLCRADITKECKTQTRRLARSLYRQWRRAYRRLRRLRRRRQPPRRRIEPRVRPLPKRREPVVDRPIDPPIRRRPLIVRTPPRRVVPQRPAPRIAVVTAPILHLESSPQQASVFVDGVFRGRTPLRLELSKDAKASQVRVEKPCYQTWTKQLAMAPGQRIHLTPRLIKAKAKTSSGAAAFGWTFVTMGALTAAVSVGFHVGSQMQQSEATKLYAQAAQASDPVVVDALYTKYKSTAEQGNTFRTIGIVTSAAAGVVLIIGIIRLATLPKAPAQCKPTPSNAQSRLPAAAPPTASHDAVTLWRSP